MQQQVTSKFNQPGDRRWLADWIDAELARSPLRLENRIFSGTLGESHYYVRQGVPPAPTLLFLSGWLTHPLVYNMGDDLERYPADWTLVLAEIPGQPGLGTLRAPTAGEFVTWLREMLDRLGPGPVYLIGESYGAIPLLYFGAAGASPEAAGLFLLAPAGIVSLRKSPRAALFAVLNRVLSSRRSMNWVMRYVNINPWTCLSSERYRAMRELMYFARNRFFCAASVPEPQTDEQLRSITLPVDVLLAEHDLVYDPAQIRKRWAELGGDSPTWHLLPGRGHALEVVPEAHDYLIARIRDRQAPAG